MAVVGSLPVGVGFLFFLYFIIITVVYIWFFPSFLSAPDYQGDCQCIVQFVIRVIQSIFYHLGTQGAGMVKDGQKVGMAACVAVGSFLVVGGGVEGWRGLLFDGYFFGGVLLVFLGSFFFFSLLLFYCCGGLLVGHLCRSIHRGLCSMVLQGPQWPGGGDGGSGDLS